MPLGRLLNIPLDDLVVRNADLLEQIYGSTTTSSKRTHDEASRHTANLLGSLLHRGFDVVDQQTLVRIWLDTVQTDLVLHYLSRPCLDRKRGASESSVETKSRDSSASLILQELEVEKSAVAARESGKHVLPSTLALVAVCELNVGVLERECLLG